MWPRFVVARRDRCGVGLEGRPSSNNRRPTHNSKIPTNADLTQVDGQWFGGQVEKRGRSASAAT